MEIASTFPKPLLDDLIKGRWLPVIGSGFSRNAIVAGEAEMPLWDDLGRALGRELRDYPYSTPLEAISAFEHEFSRARLVERVGELLLVNDAQPGSAHSAFCALPFDIVCTTNLEFLLERQYMSAGLYCQPVIDEDQLAVGREKKAVSLLKLHGDVHHPKRLVLTEADYDRFFDRYPLMATYLSSLLITRTLVLVGYSLNDPDFRQLWRIISDRLGKARRDAYALLVAPSRFDVARFERRGVKVIRIPDNGRGYGESLADVFRALYRYWTENVLAPEDVSDEHVLRELTLPKHSPNRLCFFSVPHDLQSFYRNYVFPIAEECGLVPMAGEDLVGAGDNFGARIRASIARSYAVVVDVSSQFTIQELSMARALGKGRRTLAIIPIGQQATTETRGIKRLRRPDHLHGDLSEFVSKLRDWFVNTSAKATKRLPREPQRLLEKGEHRAAIVSAMTSLEATIRQVLSDRDEILPGRMSLGRLIRQPVIAEVLGSETGSRVDEWRMIRNRTVHTTDPVEEGVAEEIVSGVVELVRMLSERGRYPRVQ